MLKESPSSTSLPQPIRVPDALQVVQFRGDGNTPLDSLTVPDSDVCLLDNDGSDVRVLSDEDAEGSPDLEMMPFCWDMRALDDKYTDISQGYTGQENLTSSGNGTYI
jgi:hypothetical protein